MTVVLHWNVAVVLHWNVPVALHWNVTVVLYWNVIVVLYWNVTVVLYWNVTVVLYWNVTFALHWNVTVSETRTRLDILELHTSRYLEYIEGCHVGTAKSRPSCSSTLSDVFTVCLYEESLGPWLYKEHQAKTLTRLCGCAG